MNHKMNSLQRPHFRIKLTAIHHRKKKSLKTLKDAEITFYHLCRLQEVAKTTDLSTVFQCTQIRSKLTRATANN